MANKKDTILMVKPKSLKTTHWIFGINVQGSDIVCVPKHLISEFKALGFTAFKPPEKNKTSKTVEEFVNEMSV